MSLKVAKLLVVLTTALVFSAFAAGDTLQPAHKSELADGEFAPVSFLALLENPERYAGRPVRVTGFLVLGFEQSWIQAEPRIAEMPAVWMDVFNVHDDSLAHDKAAEAKAIERSLQVTVILEAAYKDVGTDRSKKRDILLVTIEGIFEHKRSIAPTPETAPFQSGFGHLGKHHSRIVVEKMISAKFISEEPSPF